MISADEMNLRQKRNFIFSGFASVAESQKLELVHKLQSLAGVYYETEYFKPTATHLIACQPSLSQKFLGACASGKWILLPKYIEDSFEAGTWLLEKNYEWHEDSAVVNSGLPSCMYSAPRTCREKVLSQKAGIFSNWKVAVLLRDRRRKMAYIRILELGDAQIVKCKLESENFMDISQDLTHIFIEKEREESVRMLMKCETPFLTPDYIRNFLLRNPPPNHLDFIITNYQPKADYFSRFASRIFTGSTKQYLKEQLKPVIKKLEIIASPLVDNSASILNDDASQNEIINKVENMEEVNEDSVQNKDVKLKQELTINCTIADSVKLPELNRMVIKNNRLKQRREKRLKSANSGDTGTKKVYRRNSDVSDLKIKSRVSCTILNYFDTHHKCESSTSVLKDEISDSSVISDVIKERWKLHLQRRSFHLSSPSAFSHVADRKLLESSEISSSCTALFEPSIVEEEYENAVDLANSFLSHEQYPQHQTLNDIIYKILQVTEEEKMANKAFNLLHRVLYLHPPLNLENRQYYVNALFPSIGEELLWKHLLEIINSTEFMGNFTTEVPQSTKNKQLLLNFIVSVLEQDFHMFLKSCSYPPIDIVMKNSRPLVVTIFWHRGEVGSANHKCRELFSLLAKSLSTYQEMKFQRNTILCLQHLLALVAECCQLSQREQKAPEVSRYLGPHCDKFALAFVLTCSGVLHKTKELMLLLTTLQSQWLKLKICFLLLDQFFLKWNFKPGNDAIPLSLRKIVRQYMFPTLITAKEQDEMTSCMEAEYESHLQARNMKSRRTAENKTNLKGETALHLASMNNKIDKLRTLLTVPDIDVNAKDNAGWTPLHEACNHGHLECVEELLKWHSSDADQSKVDLLATANEGITPLHDAVLNDHINIASLLIKYGGKSLLRAKTSCGFVPLDFAHSSKMSQILKNAMRNEVENEDKNIMEHSSIANTEDASSKEPNSTTEMLLTTEQVHKYLLLVLNLFLSYLEMYDIHKLTNLLREISEVKKEASEDEQSTSSENFQTIGTETFSEEDLKIKKRRKNEQGIIYNLLEKYLMHEPSLNTLLTVADDLYVSQKLHKYQTKYEEHLKTLCVENVYLPKDLLCAIQLITL